jgi:hypothetical protein
MKLMAYCGKYNTDYAACFKNAVNLLVAQRNEMDFLDYFPMCVHICELVFNKLNDVLSCWLLQIVTHNVKCTKLSQKRNKVGVALRTMH